MPNVAKYLISRRIVTSRTQLTSYYAHATIEDQGRSQRIDVFQHGDISVKVVVLIPSLSPSPPSDARTHLDRPVWRDRYPPVAHPPPLSFYVLIHLHRSAYTSFIDTHPGRYDLATRYFVMNHDHTAIPPRLVQDVYLQPPLNVLQVGRTIRERQRLKGV